jgi:hypothetical protein
MDEGIVGEKSKFLIVLCGLTLVNAIYGITTGLASAISPVDVDAQFLDNLFARLGDLPMQVDGLKDEIESYYLNLMLNIGNLGAANFLFYGIDLIAVMLMWRLNRVGFALYVLAQLGLAFSPAVFGGFNRFGLISLGVALVWNFVWVGMYASQLKRFYR